MTSRAHHRARAGDACTPRVVVFDANLDALARRRGSLAAVAPRVEVLATASTTALRLGAAQSAAGTVALVDLVDGTRDLIDRPGEALLSQVARVGAAPVAWTAHAAPDVLAGARASGALDVVVVDPDAEIEAARLARVLDRFGLPVDPAVLARARDDGFAASSAVADPTPLPSWDTWFSLRYGCAWAPWMQVGLVLLARPGQRSAHADRLVELGYSASRKAAADRLRDLAQALAGERVGAPATVAAEARFALTALAATRPLRLPPESSASLLRAAASLRAAPSLATAAGLAALDVEWLIRVAAHLELARAQRGVGAPRSGQADADFECAIDETVAGLRGDSGGDDSAVDAQGLVAAVTAAAAAVTDAERDALFFPAARAAAALIEAERLPSPTSLGLSRASERGLTWNGATPHDLLWGRRHESPRELSSLTSAVDEALVRHAWR